MPRPRTSAVGGLGTLIVELYESRHSVRELPRLLPGLGRWTASARLREHGIALRPAREACDLAQFLLSPREPCRWPRCGREPGPLCSEHRAVVQAHPCDGECAWPVCLQPSVAGRSLCFWHAKALGNG